MCYHWNLSNIIETKHPNTKHNANNMIWSSVSPRTTKFDSTVFRNFRNPRRNMLSNCSLLGALKTLNKHITAFNHSFDSDIVVSEIRIGQHVGQQKKTLTPPMFTIPIFTPCMEYLPNPTIHSRPQCRYLIPYMEPVGLIQLPVKPPRGWKRIYLA